MATGAGTAAGGWPVTGWLPAVRFIPVTGHPPTAVLNQGASIVAGARTVSLLQGQVPGGSLAGIKRTAGSHPANDPPGTCPWLPIAPE